MRHYIVGLLWVIFANGSEAAERGLQYQGKAVTLTKAEVIYDRDLDLLIFTMDVAGKAAGIDVKPKGALHGAPVLGYVFPTNLEPENVGFSQAEGVVALAVTIHPDFDDTPLWDENNDRDYANDGAVIHPHWVVLTQDKSVPGGLSVLQLPKDQIAQRLPPTNPGMPMYMDSPGFSVVLQGKTLKVLVPAQRMDHRKDFRFDAVTAYMEVNTSGLGPMLGSTRSTTSSPATSPYPTR